MYRVFREVFFLLLWGVLVFFFDFNFSFGDFDYEFICLLGLYILDIVVYGKVG